MPALQFGQLAGSARKNSKAPLLVESVGENPVKRQMNLVGTALLATDDFRFRFVDRFSIDGNQFDARPLEKLSTVRSLMRVHSSSCSL
jgi:hypothetical protein